MGTLSIDERLDAVEAGLEELKNYIEAVDALWWEQWLGAYKHDSIFDSAMKRGEEYRRTITGDGGPSSTSSS